MIMEIKPFKAFRFNQAVVGDVNNCISPPYDVINSEKQKQLYDKGPYNIVRIIKSNSTETDGQNQNPHAQAAELFDSWLQAGVLKQDANDTIYAYVQDFQIGGADFQRLTFIALAKLEKFGPVVRPHEEILSKPVTDRLNLIRATKAQFGLVFMLYDDPEGIADKAIQKTVKSPPLIDYLDDDAVRHRLFAITDKNMIKPIVEMMRDKSCIIADGHHRYTTGLLYSKENHEPAAKYQMLAFCNSSHEGLIVLATHRVAGSLENFDSEKFFTGLGNNFELTKYGFDSAKTKEKAKKQMLTQMKAEHHKNKNTFGVYAGNGAFYVAVLKNTRSMDEVADAMSSPWKSLDVSVLQKLILEKLLGLDEEKVAGGKYLKYVKDGNNTIDELIEKIDSKCEQVAFFLNPPKIGQIRAVAEHGERMPQKSTYFYPKVFSGLTIQKI